jgi:hypothetical protein
MKLKATATLHRREMNHVETKYALHLQERLLVGEIRWWAYEAWKFRLADNTTYTPDFVVVTNDMKLEAHEVKAYWKSVARAGWTDDARVKIKVAAEQHPIRFLAVSLMPDQSWKVEQFGEDREEPTPPDELALEMESHDAEIRRIAEALDLIGAVTVEDIVKEIQRRV